MGLLLSVVVSYAGVLEAIQCYRRIKCGVLPDGAPDFGALQERYALELRDAANPSRAARSWLEDGNQGYLCLEEDAAGELASACVKYYGADSAAILFSAKISSFGQESVEGDAWGRCDVDRDTSSTATRISQSCRALDVGRGNRSPSPPCDDVSDVRRSSGDPSECEAERREKLTWHYRPLGPAPDSPLPQINFQPYESDRELERTPRPDSERDESFLRSTRGLQRSEASGRRRSFRKRHSSSPSSRESREEELRALSSLEEAELAAPNDPPKPDSLGENVEPAQDDKVTQPDDELDDFWGSSTGW